MSRPPLVLVVGTDRYSVADRFRVERDRLVAGEAAGIEVFDAEEADGVGRAMDAARTPAMFGGSRLVGILGTLDAAALDRLDAWCDSPSPDCTLLVAHVQAGAPSKAQKNLLRRAEELGRLVELGAPPTRRQDVGHWVRERAAACGVTFTSEAEQAVGESVGGDAGALDALCRQLAAAHPGVRLGISEVRPYTAATPAARAWDLTDAIDRGDVEGALRTLRGLRDLHPLQIQTSLANHVRRIRLALSLRATGAQQLQQELGLKPYPAKKLAAQLRHVDLVSADNAHRLVTKAEEAMHGGSGLDPETVLDMLVARLARSLGPRR
ncbi:MAG: hypothetical protein IT198_17900 [Acidimicrobiia bacterium]|nr:hypothetical protein [Acidimicrobiia bacterium]